MMVNTEIIFILSRKNIFLSLELLCQGSPREGSQHMFIWRDKKIIPKLPSKFTSCLEICVFIVLHRLEDSLVTNVSNEPHQGRSIM